MCANTQTQNPTPAPRVSSAGEGGREVEIWAELYSCDGRTHGFKCSTIEEAKRVVKENVYKGYEDGAVVIEKDGKREIVWMWSVDGREEEKNVLIERLTPLIENMEAEIKEIKRIVEEGDLNYAKHCLKILKGEIEDAIRLIR